MQIKKLVLKNFKSFKFNAIPFKKGFHTIVGPNGSGKSNIIDALLFVFGTTSLKKLRVDKLANLVNHNSKSKTARVRVIFEHEGKEYEIVRQINKEGKSVLYLNDKRKALNEITSFLHGLGISAQGYNTVQQGDVTRIINLKPEERRGIIEDVSGIGLFDERKREAEKNLKKVDKRLDKVSIALNERKPYVEQLKSEKEDALKYNKLDSLEKKYNYNVIKKELKDLNKQDQIIENQIEESRYKIEEENKEKKGKISKKNELEIKIEDLNSRLINFSDNLQDTIGKKYSNKKANKEILENNIELKENNLNYLKNENQKVEEDINYLKKEKEDLQHKINTNKDKLNKLKEEKTKLKTNIDSNKEEYTKQKEKQEDLYNRLSNINKKINNTQDKYFKEENKLNAYNLQLENLENKEKEKQENLKKYNAKQKNLKKDISILELDINKLNKEIDNLNTKESNLKEQKEDLLNKINQQNIDLASFKKEKQIRTNIISEIDQVKKDLSKFSTFLGFLEDFVNLKSSQKTYYSNYIVLKNSSEVKKILKNLNSKINLSFVILDILNIKTKDLSKFIKTKEKKKRSKKIKGFYFDGFSYKKVLFKDSKILDKKINSLEKDLKKNKSKLENTKEEINIINNKILSKKEKLNSKDISLNTKIEVLDDLNNNISEIKEISSKVNKKDINKHIKDLKSSISLLDQEINSLKKEKQDIEKEISQIDLDSQTNLRDTYDEIVSKVNNLEQFLISKKSNLKAIDDKTNSKEGYILENKRKIEHINKELSNFKSNLEDLNKKIKSLKEKLDIQESKKKKLIKEKEDLSRKLTTAYEEINAYDSKIEELNSNINSYNIDLSTNESRITQLENNLELLDIDDLHKELMSEDLGEIKSLLRKVKREKNALGNINFNAIDSYDKLAKEYDEIKEKYEILLEEKEEVQSLLSEINMKKETIFKDCFDKVNKEFKKIISQMSSFLSGNLKLDGEDLLKSKLIINLTKNRKTKDIDIMSGGEKTITALAFIFAINSYKKLPFYILDEVDAALDDINSKNLMNYLKELSKDSTIISITHNNIMISGSNQVIGVTLKENSSVIGLDL